MDIPFRFFPSAVYHQEYCLGQSVMCVTIWRRKFSKNSDLDCFQVCAIDHEFKKYVHTKLFQHVTYSQRDKLLNTQLPLPNVRELLTIQEAETRIILDEEAAYSLSQGDEATFDPLDFNPRTSTFLNATNSINSNSKIAQGNTRILGHHLGSTSTEGRVSFRQATRLFHIKNMAKC